MNFPVFDLHCDTALKLLGERCYADGFLRKNQFHIDLERAQKYPAFGQCFACFSSPLNELPGNMTVEDMFERQISVLLREINENADLIRQAYSADDVLSNKKSGKMSAVFTIEGPAGFDYDPALLENLYQIGFRITTMGWNEHNILTGSHLTGEGISDLGKEYVIEAQRLGMLIDVSHISDQGFWDVINISNKPIIASHSNSRSVCPHTRNITDEMFLALCQSNGIVGINFCADFVGENPSIDSVCDHFCHFLELEPSGKHLALGSDFDGVSILPDGINGVESFEALAEKLFGRGLSEQMIMDIFWNNAIGVLKSCCM